MGSIVSPTDTSNDHVENTSENTQTKTNKTIGPFLNLTNLNSFGLLSLSREELAKTPYPMWSNALLAFGFSIRSMKQPLGYPGYGPLAIASLIFGAIGYNVIEDKQFGASTATGWCLIYAVMAGEKAFKSRKPGPIFMTLWSLGIGCIYGPTAWERVFG